MRLLTDSQRGREWSPQEKLTFEKLINDKHNLMIEGLRLRRRGAEGLTAAIAGRSEHLLHPYSRNSIEVRVDSYSHARYRTIASLLQLRSVGTEDTEDIVDLIGQPDEFQRDSTADFFGRTIYEIRHVNNVIDKANLGSFEAAVLSNLAFDLASRVLLVGQVELVPGGRLFASHSRIENESGSTIFNIGFVNMRRRIGFNLRVGEPEKIAQIKDLIDHLPNLPVVESRV